MEKSTSIALDTTILFERLNDNLAQQGEMSMSGGVTIGGLHLKGDTEWLYAEADVKGPYNGKVVVQFTVTFDNETKRFSLHNLNIELADDSMFAKMANKFVNNMFGDKLDGKLEEVVNAKFMAMLDEIFGQVRKIDLPKGGSLGFDINSYNLHNLKTDARGMHFVAELIGESRLEY